jgi:hypothetical protein
VTTATQDEMFPTLPSRTVFQECRDDYNRFRREFDRLGGALPPRYAAAFLGVSRQRVYQLIESKDVRSTILQGAVWVSLADIVERIKSPTPNGRPPKKS